MQVLQEITVWEGVAIQPNHIYLTDSDKMLAYIPFGKGDPVYFSKPIQFSKAKRKFKELKKNPFTVKKPSTAIKVQGSKGAVYEVDPEAKTCTCPGFTYRGQCKHITEVLNGEE